MIITKLCGGLGNQLFQWAAAKNVAVKYDTDVLCDLSHFGSCKAIRTEDRIKEVGESRITPWGLELDKVLNGLEFVDGNVHSLRPVNEASQCRTLDDNTYLTGFWQSETYFAENADEIRFDLKLSHIEKNALKSLYPFIEDNTVSVHVRRGDYVNLQHMHPCQTVEYYDKALESIGEFSNILVFSDDINWCKENFKYDNMHFSEGQDNVTDLYTMSLCSHNVVANSSFSWWGAWLNENPSKKVVAPSYWFANGTASENIIPNNWIKI